MRDISILGTSQTRIHLNLRGRRDLANSFIKIVSRLHATHSLDLGNSNIGDRDIQQLAPLPMSLSFLGDLSNLHTLNLENTEFSDEGALFLADFQRLRSLMVRNTKITDIGVIRLTPLDKLEFLQLGYTNITDAVIPHFVSSFKQLRMLGLGKTRVTHISLPYLAGLSKLTRLSLSHLDATIESVSHFKSALPNLKIYWSVCYIKKLPAILYRKVADFFEMSDLAHVKQTSKLLFDVEPLEVSSWKFKSLKQINECVQRLKKTRIVSFGLCSRSGGLSIKSAQKIGSHLRELTLTGGITGKNLLSFKFLTALTALEFQSSIIPDEIIMKSLSYLKNLKTFTWHVAWLGGNVVMSSFPRLPHLESFDLTLSGDSKVISPASLEAQTKSLQNLEHCGKLIKLILRGPRLTNESLSFLSKLRQLQVLGIVSGKRITNEGMRHVVYLPNLTALNLSDTGITGEGLSGLPSSLPRLQYLNISDNKIGDEGMVYITPFDKLITLGIGATEVTDVGLHFLTPFFPQLKKLDLSNNPKITDQGIAFATLFRQLTYIGLEGKMNITDNGLISLNFLPELKLINLTGNSQITNEGFRQLSYLGKTAIK